jgi:aspartyl-tRNA(Asn)/glutamyl-tRNA(Gln) amidotransferase subunit B
VQETRLYDPDRDETRSMRSKEDAMDYRYFPDPDLLPLEVTQEWIDEVKASMPELPQRQRELILSYAVPINQANQLTSNKEISTFALSTFESAPIANVPMLANWILGPLSAKLNQENIDISDSKVKPSLLRELSIRVTDGTISNSAATTLITSVLWEQSGTIDEIIAAKGLKQISDSGEIEKIVDEVLAANAKSVEEFRAGKEKAFNSLVGQVMKATKGKANPAQVNELLKKKLSG